MELSLVQTFVSYNLKSVSYHVYILRCNDGTYYTGQTTDLDKRLLAHNRGTGARYTRGRGPVQLVFHVGVGTLKEAFLLEHKIKRMPRAGKEKLIAATQTIS
jgi:putative endonuclease